MICSKKFHDFVRRFWTSNRFHERSRVGPLHFPLFTHSPMSWPIFAKILQISSRSINIINTHNHNFFLQSQSRSMIFWDFCGLKPFETSNLLFLQPGCSCCSIPGAWQHWGSAESPSRQPRCDSYVFRCVLGCTAMDIYGYRICTCYNMLQLVATCYNMLQPMLQPMTS